MLSMRQAAITALARPIKQQSVQQPFNYGYERNNNLNPDFQLGGSWWRTNSKLKSLRRHHGSVHRQQRVACAGRHGAGTPV
jgi:hypothetical protein